MAHKQKPVWIGRRFALALINIAVIFALTLVELPAQAVTELPSAKTSVGQMVKVGPEDPHLEPQEQPEWWYAPNVTPAPPTVEDAKEPPMWWYDPDKPVMTSEAVEGPERPEWWYAPQGDQTLSAPGFTTMDIDISLPGGQSLNAGAIPLNVMIAADDTTPEFLIEVTSEDVPDRAVYVGYEKTPDGAVQTLGGFQQAKFLGGVGPDNSAEITFKYEPLTTGWINFTVQVWSEGNLIRGPESRSVYVSAAPATFTNIETTVSLASSWDLNAGAMPLDVGIVADGATPELVVQVTSEDVPDRVIYAGYEKNPDGAIQTLGGFQQAKFLGGVGPDNSAEITFNYEPLATGWIDFTVTVWSEGNQIHGPEVHSIYVNSIAPTFTSFDMLVTDTGSQGLNAGVISFDVKVMANGKTPELVVQVTSDGLPEKAVYVGYEKIPDGAIQTLGGFQQAKFLGGVGPDNVAEVTFKYEPLTTGWINFTVQVWSEGNLLYGPDRRSIYVRETGPSSTSFPPLINRFAIASQDYNLVVFEVGALGNPEPEYQLDCGSADATLSVDAFSCHYNEEPGVYTARLTASNCVEGVDYRAVATTRVLVPRTVFHIPLVVVGNH